MKLYVIENDDGKWWSNYVQRFTSNDQATLYRGKDAADYDISELGSSMCHVVELVKKPNPVEVTKEEAAIIEQAKKRNFNFLLYDDANDFIACSIPEAKRVYDILRAFYTDSYRVKPEQRYYVKVPHTYDFYYYKTNEGLAAENSLALTGDYFKFTQDEIKQYALQDYERVKVPTDDDTNE